MGRVAGRLISDGAVASCFEGRPVMAVAREQPDTLDDQAIAVVLDLVDPVGTVGDFGATSRQTRLKGGFQHSGKARHSRTRIQRVSSA
jgi:hypothetical protein